MKLWLFHGGGPYHIELSSLICRANQWTGFHMIGISFMKEGWTLSWYETFIEHSIWRSYNYNNSLNMNIKTLAQNKNMRRLYKETSGIHWVNQTMEWHQFRFSTKKNSVAFTLIKSFLDQRSLHQKCPYSELFWSVFFCIWSISPYSVRMRKIRTKITPNTDTFYAVVLNGMNG